MKVCLCTEEVMTIGIVNELLKGLGKIKVLTKDMVPMVLDNSCKYTHFILAVSAPNDSDWNICRNIANSGIDNVYLMIKRKINPNDRALAKQNGIADIVLNPIHELKEFYYRQEKGFIGLNENFKLLLPSMENKEELIRLEKNTYFHSNELWVGNEKHKKPLSFREVELLNLFLKNEGKVLRREEIADKIWNGQIENSSIQKLIQRLKEKIGNETNLIYGRKQGGYIFKKEKI